MFLESTNGLHVEDLCVYNSAARPDHILDLRTHSSDAADLICHIKYGSAVLQYDDTPLFTVTRTVYLPHGSHYRLSFLKESAFILVSFQLFRENRRISPPRELSFDISLEQEFQDMESVVAHAGVLGDLRRKAVFFNLLAKCAPELSEQFSPGFSRISHGVAAIEAQFLTNTAISEYAALCGLRENRFRQLFTQYFSMSPVEYRNTLRMRYAHALMSHFNCSVADAAHAAGFASTSYFCRLHRKMFGVSPAGMEEEDDQMDKMV